jgi:probable rRNA maturation factor
LAGPYQFAWDNRQRGKVAVDRKELWRVARIVLDDEEVSSATIGVLLVGNDEMQAINNESLGHDYPTDVLSFSYADDAADRDDATESIDAPVSGERGPKRRGRGLALEGDIVLGAAYAAETALEYGWSVNEELSLYLAHGLLHLCGYDDLSAPEKRIMRRREREVLALAGLAPPYRRR